MDWYDSFTPMVGVRALAVSFLLSELLLNINVVQKIAIPFLFRFLVNTVVLLNVFFAVIYDPLLVSLSLLDDIITA
jgi:hypothetical protein